ncbi:helix-hairpin-helix domain-containing protein [Sanguibacter sp. 25GB23B1]|uniref:helix-hairpin-helix domain-containing protein n=1 Tax=unclassified Sanguibacter TaxID=2645534 RepID=UPI0032AEB987
MEVRARHVGRGSPFERERRLVLRRIPVGAVVTRATVTLTPVSTDAGARFVETLTFAPGTVPGSWGATKVVTAGALEVDLHARRRLAGLTGSGLGPVAAVHAPFLVDLGGGYLAVDEDGGFTDASRLALADSMNLPGLTVTGFRVARGGTDLSALRVSSPPSNVLLAFGGGPVFFTHLGDLVSPVTTPDVSDLLQALLPQADVENGCSVVELVIRSDAITRLDVGLDLELSLAVPAAGGPVAQAPYRYDGIPVDGAGTTTVRVPQGCTVVAGGVTGRVQGAFAATQVVYGPVTDHAVSAAGTASTVGVTLVPVEAGHSVAQAFVTDSTVVATSVDLPLVAVTASATLAVDLVDDLDGKPGSTSWLPRPATLSLTRETAGSPTWLSTTLPREVEVPVGRRTWLVVQATEGRAAWSAHAGTASAPAAAGIAPLPPLPALHATRDGGLSWRAVPAGEGADAGSPLAAPLRLRRVSTAPHVPIELRVRSGAGEVPVSLQHLAGTGEIDLELATLDVAGAVNTVLAGAGGVPPTAEHVANGTFAEWYRLGGAVRRAGTLTTRSGVVERPSSHTIATFDPGGTRAVVLGPVDDSVDLRLLAFDVLSGERELATTVGEGVPTGVGWHPAGRLLVVGTDPGTGFSTEAGSGGGTLLLVDPTTGSRVGMPVGVPEAVVACAAAGDGSGVYVLGADQAGPDGSVAGGVLRHVGWAALEEAALGAPLDWDALPVDRPPGAPVALAAAHDGSVVLLAAAPLGADAARLYSYRSVAAVRARDSREAPAAASRDAVAVACAAGEVLVLTPTSVRVLGPHLTVVSEVPLDAPASNGGRALAHAIAVDAAGTMAVVALEDRVDAVDVSRRRVVGSGRVGTPVGEGTVRVAVSAPGTHAVVTRSDGLTSELLTVGDALPVGWELTAGRVRPVSLPGTGEVLALLGTSPSYGEVRREPVGSGPASLSQVVPVAGGARYRFAFDAVSVGDGAVAQVRWRGDGCTPERTDRVAVAVFDADAGHSLDRVPRYERVLVAPSGATQAEVRFFTPDALLAVDRVSLAGTTAVTTSSWDAPSAGLTVTPTESGFTATSAGAAGGAEGSVAQSVGVRGGQDFTLVVAASVAGTASSAGLGAPGDADGPGARLELAFAAATGEQVGDVVVLTLGPLDLDAHAAFGVVPEGAEEATLSLVVPPGGTVEVTELALSVGDATEVELYFASEAPGDVRTSGAGVVVDAAPPQSVPVPPGGLCPSTPPGDGPDGESCYCQGCGRRGPVVSGRPAVVADSRPVTVTPCPTCGTDRVRAGGRVVLRAQPVALPRFAATDRPALAVADGSRGPAIVARLRVDRPVTDVVLVGQARAVQLRALGIADVVALARADAVSVATLPGVSDAMAERIIASAAVLVREEGHRELFAW